MAWLRRAALFVFVLAATTIAQGVGDPPQAKANIACDVGGSPVGAVTGAIGFGNPVGDACNAITDPVLGGAGHVLDPLKDAAASLGKGVFDQITTWAADGAVWLLGQVVELTNKTTTPDLLGKGFLRQYRRMAAIAVVLALAMLLFACLEGLGRGDGGMLWRVFFVNVPVAALATSAAYVVVQLLIATTDGFCEAIAHSTATDTRNFFKGAIEALAESGAGTGPASAGPAGAPGAAGVQVPLFVGFIAAVLAAFAAFLVWIELLMRDAAIYVVALFMPLALAASIWPRWTGALRRTAELVLVIVSSKFVIVAIIALAASLLANTGGKVEQVLAAGALLLLACFSPLVLFKLMPFAEGAVGAAYGRQSASGGVARSVQSASSVQMMRRSAFANWSASSKGGDSSGKGGGKKDSGACAKTTPAGSGGVDVGAGGAGGASGGAASAAALPVVAGASAAKAAKAAGGQLEGSGTAQAAGGTGSGTAASGGPHAGSGAGESRPRPRAEDAGASGASPAAASSTPMPSEAEGGQAHTAGAKPPRPSADGSAVGKSSGEAKP